MRTAFQPKGINLSIRPQVRIAHLFFTKPESECSQVVILAANFAELLGCNFRPAGVVRSSVVEQRGRFLS